MSVVNNPLMLRKAAAASGDPVRKSLRFDRAGSSKLTRTLSAGSTQKFTFSCWVKRSAIPTYGLTVSAQHPLIGAPHGAGEDILFFQQPWSNTGNWLSITTPSWAAITTEIFSDPSTWYHILLSSDTTQSADEDAIKIWVNGIQRELTFSDTAHTHTWAGLNQAVVHSIGHYPTSGSTYLDGYLSDVYFIDGEALTPSDFTKTDDNGQLVPDTFSESYGTNGFHLPFEETAGNDVFTDSSSNTHTITTNGDTVHTRAESKVGGSSIYFDNNEDYLIIPASSDFAFGEDDWTVDFWTKIPTQTSQHGAGAAAEVPLFSNGRGAFTGDTDKGLDIRYEINIPSSGTGALRVNGIESGDTITFNHDNSYWYDDEWHHVAVVRNGDDLSYYFDGTLVGSPEDCSGKSYGTATDVTWLSKALYGSSALAWYTKGWLDQLRVSNNARWTDDFDDALPTTAYADDANTMLLVQSDWNGGLFGDGSGNNHDFDATNIAVTDQVLDSPSSGKNYATLNPLANGGGTLSEGNLKIATSGTTRYRTNSTFQIPSSGKWYVEAYMPESEGWTFGLSKSLENGWGDAGSWTDGGIAGWYRSSVINIYNINGAAISASITYPTGGVFQIAIDADTGKVWYGKGNTWYGASADAYDSFDSSDPSETIADISDYFITAGTYSGTTLVANFGQDPTMAGNVSITPATSEFVYEPPTDFKSLSTENLPTPSITDPTEHFKTILWTGDDVNPRTFEVGFQPDLTWVKDRSTAREHQIVDSVRGAPYTLASDSSNDETGADAGGNVSEFTSTGFKGEGSSNNGNVNYNGREYVAWNWKAGTAGTGGTAVDWVESYNATAGFSIVKFTGDGYTDENCSSGGSTYPYGSTQDVEHSLGVKPEFILAASRDNMYSTTGGFRVWHKDLNESIMELSASTAAESTGDDDDDTIGDMSSYPYGSPFYTVDATKVTFNNGLDDSNNVHFLNYGGNYSDNEAEDDCEFDDDADGIIAYLWAGVDGYSKFGTYEGTNSENPSPFIYLGWKPALILIKAYDYSDATSAWAMFDSSRSSYNIERSMLRANTTGVEDTTATADLDLLSNGFKIRYTPNETNGPNTYIYAAFAESPFKFNTGA